MGIKPIDLAPPNGVTSTTPPAKDVQLKAFKVTRSDTTASVKMILPADATVVDIQLVGVASDAATTATLSLGTTSTSTEWVNAVDVKAAGGKLRPSSSYSATNLPNLEGVPLGGAINVYAVYAETGTASTVGGPWTVTLWYVR